MDIEREAFEKFANQFSKYEWEDLGRDDVFYAGMKAARQAPASGEVEPVAWECTEKHGATVDVAGSRDIMETYLRMGRIIRPLVYGDTHPPAKVPEDVSKQLKAWSRAPTGWPKGTAIEKVKSQIDKLHATPTPATTPETEWVIEPDQFWDADNSETNYDSLYELADIAAQDLRKGETMTVSVLCAKRLPSRQMKIWVKDDDEIDFEWTWTPTAQEGE